MSCAYSNTSAIAVELAWYAPTIRYAGKPEDRQNYLELLKELKNTATKLGWQVGVAIKIIDGRVDYYGISSISRHVDWIRIETHGLHTHWEDFAGFNAPLYSRKGDRKTVAYWINHIAALSDSRRLLLELPFYGRPWALTPEPIPGGPGSQAAGFLNELPKLPFNKVCEMLRRDSTTSSPWQEKWDPYSMTPWAISGNRYISYDNERSLKAKVEFARHQNLAGVSINSVGMDDFMGKCGKGKMPLLNAVKAAVSSSLKL